jgi:hypothetical protein
MRATVEYKGRVATAGCGSSPIGSMMYQMFWDYLIGLASLKELEAFIKTRT